MEKDQAIGVVIVAGSIIGIILYFWLVLLSPWSGFIIALTLFLVVAALMVILGWIGWTMATTPAPKPLEDSPPPPPETKEETKAEPSDSDKAVTASPKKRRGRGRA